MMNGNRLVLLLGLGLAIAWPAAAQETGKYLLTFKTYPPGTKWSLVTANLQPSTAAIPVEAQDVMRGVDLRVQFSHPHFKTHTVEDLNLGEFAYDVHGVGMKVKPEYANGLLEWPEPIVLEPDNPLIGAVYLMGYHWLLTSLSLTSVLASVGVAWRKHRQNQALRNRQLDLEALASRASAKDDPLVRDQRELGPYKIVDKLGEGGMATVYRALPSDSLDEKAAVALKLMKASLTSPEDRKRFLREIQVIRQLNHPNIVRLEHFGETQDEELYMAMELIDGKPLTIEPQGQSPEAVSQILRPLLKALIYAHGCGVVHRDIKPANLLLSSSGVLKVMDFGLARTHEATQVTQTGTMLGSPAYVSPEQLTGGVLDPRSDQYSLGASLFEMLTGHVPFERSDTMAVLMAHMTEAPTSMREWHPYLSPSLDRVVLRMLEKNPQARYPDLEAVAQAWEEALKDPNAFADWQPTSAVSPHRPAPAAMERPPNLPLDGGQDTIC